MPSPSKTEKSANRKRFHRRLRENRKPRCQSHSAQVTFSQFVFSSQFVSSKKVWFRSASLLKIQTRKPARLELSMTFKKSSSSRSGRTRGGPPHPWATSTSGDKEDLAANIIEHPLSPNLRPWSQRSKGTWDELVSSPVAPIWQCDFVSKPISVSQLEPAPMCRLRPLASRRPRTIRGAL
jgi:hypothetical protein